MSWPQSGKTWSDHSDGLTHTLTDEKKTASLGRQREDVGKESQYPWRVRVGWRESTEATSGQTGSRTMSTHEMSSSPVVRAVLLRHCFTVSRLGSVLSHHGRRCTQMMTVPSGMSNMNWMYKKMSGTRSRIVSPLRSLKRKIECRNGV